MGFMEKGKREGKPILHFLHRFFMKTSVFGAILRTYGTGAATDSLYMIPPHTKAISEQDALSSVPQALEGAFCVFDGNFPLLSADLGLTGLFRGAIIKRG